MKNTLSKNMNGLLTSAISAAQGAALHGAGIGLAQNIELNIRNDRAAAVAARDNHEAGKVVLRQRMAAALLARDQSRAFAMLTRDNLKPTLGGFYSEAWDPTGFVGSLEVPQKAEDLEPLMELFQTFFTANPALEIPARDIT